MSPKALMFVATTIVVLATAVAGAQGIAFTVIDEPSAGAQLNRLELLTGELTPVGAIGYPTNSIAFDSAGSLFGLGPIPTHLIAIDAQGGTGTEVGPLGITITDVRGLAFCDGDRLWLTAYDATFGPSLYEVDASTGAGTRFVGLAPEHFGSLACDGDTLFVAHHALASVDTTTGVVTPLPSSDFGIWLARAIDRDDFGGLWGLMLCGVCMGPSDVLTIRTIDPNTGTLQADGPFEPHGTWGLAILHGGVFVDGFETGSTDGWSATFDESTSRP